MQLSHEDLLLQGSRILALCGMVEFCGKRLREAISWSWGGEVEMIAETRMLEILELCLSTEESLQAESGTGPR